MPSPLRAVLIVGLLTAGVLAGSMSGGPAVAQPAPGRLDTRVAQVADAFDRNGAGAATTLAESLGIGAGGGRVRVIVEHDGDGRGIGVAGARREASYGDLAQFSLPPGALRGLAAQPGVRLVRAPMHAVPLAVTGEGVALINADDWHTGGVTGAGRKVAVLDLGFAGYEALLGDELPATVTAMSFRADADITGGGIDHGTQVAQIVHEVAPGASLYLVNFDTEAELAAASLWLSGQGVHVVNASWGYFVSGPGNGTGIVDDIVTASTAAGTLWAAAAGNHAARHWSGNFRDTDSDGFHEFQDGPFQDEGNQVIGAFFGLLLAGEKVNVELKWDDPFGAACQDYNLYLKRTDDNNQPVTAASSEDVQHDGTDCVGGADPVEKIEFTVVEFDTYHIVVTESHTTRDAYLDLYSGFHDTEYTVIDNSLLQPADHPAALTAGAVCWCSPASIEAFSSRGPNTDGVIKPDVVGPDGVSNPSGAFFGTSAASPHVAGAAALVGQALPCFTPAQTKAYIEAGAVDLGVAGKDNTFGSGRLSLGALPPDLDGDAVADECDDDMDGDGCTNDAETGVEATLGGDRNPEDPWDFFDVNGDRSINLSDTLQILGHFGHGPADDAFDDVADRTAPDALKPWRTAADANGVDLGDALLNLQSFGHDCNGP